MKDSTRTFLVNPHRTYRALEVLVVVVVVVVVAVIMARTVQIRLMEVRTVAIRRRTDRVGRILIRILDPVRTNKTRTGIRIKTKIITMQTHTIKIQIKIRMKTIIIEIRI